jgi:putative redox protein
MKDIVQVSLDQEGASASRARARDHDLVMDRPSAKGGENKGPMGGDVLLMGLGGCFMSNLLAAAQARDMAFEAVHLDISGTLETAPSRFSAISIGVRGSGMAPETVQKMVTIAERACIVANTLKPGVNVSITPVE